MGSSYTFFVIKWSVPLLIAVQLSTNHYVRDAVGALERQLEDELITPHDYSLLNAFYFFPNIITPLLAGIFVEKIGGVVSGYIYSLLISLIGHLIFSLGIQFTNKGLMFFGKALSGAMYEILDALMPILYLGALYKDDFQLVVGFMQIFIRLGSVINFIVTPRLYAMYGLNVALWVASVVGMSGLILFLMARFIEVNWYLKHPDYKPPSADLSIQSGHGGSSPNAEFDETCHKHPSTAHISSNGECIGPASSSFTIEIEDAGDDPHPPTGLISNINPASLKSSAPSNSHSVFQKLYRDFMDMTQFDKFDAKFYFYFSAGSLLYGSVVPFWFFGSKYLQENFGLTVDHADTLVSIPELCMVFVGFPLGLTVTKFQWSNRTRLRVVCGAMFCIFLAFSSLLLTAIHRNKNATMDLSIADPNYIFFAILSVLLVGIGFSFACSLFWGCINAVVDSKYFNQASGLTSCGVNVLPSILPPILVSFRFHGDHQIVACIALLALIGSICAFVASDEETSRLFGRLFRCRDHEESYNSLAGYSQHGLLETSQHSDVNIREYEMIQSQLHDDGAERNHAEL